MDHFKDLEDLRVKGSGLGFFGDYMGVILGFCKDTGKDKGHYSLGFRGYIGLILGFCRDNGKEHGKYYGGLYRVKGI